MAAKKEKDLRNLTAVALAYEKGDMAPVVVASGKGRVAQKIIETAQENDVPLHEEQDNRAEVGSLWSEDGEIAGGVNHAEEDPEW